MFCRFENRFDSHPAARMTTALIIILFQFAVPEDTSASIALSRHDCQRESYGTDTSLNEERSTQILEDLRQKTGLNGMAVVDDGFISAGDERRTKGGSEYLRHELLGAITDKANVFLICGRTGSKDLHFAAISAGESRVVTEFIDGEFKEGGRHTVFVISLDFEDYKNSELLSPEAVLNSHSLGLSIFHEINHRVSYDPKDRIPDNGIRPDESNKGVRGTIENTNRVRRELGLIQRKSNQHNGRRYKGRISRFKYCFEIEFQSSTGTIQYLRWQREEYRSG